MELACAICSARSVVTFGGFPFCVTHVSEARKMRDARAHQPMTFEVLAAAFEVAPKDANGDAAHKHDPIVAAWLGDIWQRGRASG